MISAQHRFRGQNGILYVYRNGRTVRTKHCSAKFIINPKRTDYRASIVVSKKVSKSAPLRNRIRRRLYEHIRLLAPRYLHNQDVVITVYDQELAFADPHAIELLVRRILKTIYAMSKP